MTIKVKQSSLKKIKQSFTPLLIASLQCTPGKNQCLFWDNETPNFGIRVTASGNKAYIFESSLQNKSIRITLGSVKSLTLDEARKQAIKLKSLIRMGVDPRKIQNKRTVQWVDAKTVSAQNKLKNETLKSVWLEYANVHANPIINVKAWSKRRYAQHLHLIDTVLTPLATVKMSDLSVAHIKAWGNNLVDIPNSHLRFNAKLCLQFLTWCHQHETYQLAVPKTMLEQTQQWVNMLNVTGSTHYLTPELLPKWFSAINAINDDLVKRFLKIVLLTGRSTNDILHLKWNDIDFEAATIQLFSSNSNNKLIPLSRAVSDFLKAIPNNTEVYVFEALRKPTPQSQSIQQWHQQACKQAGIAISLNDLPSSYSLFSEWVETPAGITAQLQDMDIKGISAHHFARRPLEVLKIWQQKIEDWILRKANT